MIYRIVLILSVWLSTMPARAQQATFTVYLEPLNISGLGGLQSYAVGQHNGKWLIVGGRLDGLHRRQPFAAFDVAGNNNQLIVVDPVAGQRWSAPLTSLPVSVQEQLSSTNMEFHQRGNFLYVIGGYGYHNATASRKTFEFLTAIDVPAVINAVMSGTPFTAFFRQLANPLFAVTGGHLKKINNTFYLVGGNKFDGNYNPAGNPTFTQVYTNAIHKFNIIDDGTSLSVQHLQTITDAANLHRRDYNAVPQILPDGAEGITAFSGVFQHTADLPFLNCVNIDSVSYAVNNAFQQYYNHYHCAVLPMYDATRNEMHSVFFGGIAQFYDNAGALVQDNDVPFVKTIARVTRNAAGVMTEHKLAVEMPSLLGAGAEFIPNPAVPHYSNEVLQLHNFTSDTTMVGYIYGGISSSAPNIFFINTGVESSASSQVFRVYVVKLNTTLHLNLQHFSASPATGYNLLQWRLGTGTTVKQVVVEYSFDGNNFAVAQQVPHDGAAATMQVQDAGWWINNRVLLYRLKLVGADGTFNYSSTIRVVCGEPGKLQLRLSPNPTNGNFVVDYTLAQTSRVRLRIFSMAGHKLKEEAQQRSAGVHQWYMQLQGQLAAGVYLLTLEAAGETATRRIVIE